MTPAYQFACALIDKAGLFGPEAWAAQPDGEAVSCTVDGFRLCLSRSLGVIVHNEAGWPLLVMGPDALDEAIQKTIETQIGRVFLATNKSLSLNVDRLEMEEREALRSLVSRLGHSTRKRNYRPFATPIWPHLRRLGQLQDSA